MKKLISLSSLFIFLSSFAFASPQQGYYRYSFSRLSYVKGDVFIQRASDLGYEEGVVNLPLIRGDKLATREGWAEIHFGRRNYVRLNSFSQLELANLPEEGNDLTSLHLLTGEIFLRINFLKSEKDFEVHTPDASFYILAEGLYRFKVRENLETELFVYEGAAEAAGEEGSILVQTKEKLMAVNGRFQSNPVFFYAAYDDDFALWSRSRDGLLGQIASRRYLPSELYEYEVELAANGRWVYERPYGYVWVPYVYQYQWRPYYYGRWLWYPIIGWTWVSYEPWGWCVYHYGRWHWRLGLGWYWIPTRYWGPAWVHWYSGYDYIGWCPLSYYGSPVVIINNHFYGKYSNQYYPLNSRALVVIRKDQLQAPRISRVALAQNSIIRLGKISLSSAQPPLKPQLSKLSLRNQNAKKIFTKSGRSSINRHYASGQRISSSRLSSNFYSKKSLNSTLTEGKIYPSSKSVSKTFTQGKYQMSARRNKISSNSLSTRSISNSRSNSLIKLYPSRQKTAYSQQRRYVPRVKTRQKTYFAPSQRRSQSFYSTPPSSRVKHYSSSSSRVIFKGKVSSNYSLKSQREGQRYIGSFSYPQGSSSWPSYSSRRIKPSPSGYFSSHRTSSSYISRPSSRNYPKYSYSYRGSYSTKVSRNLGSRPAGRASAYISRSSSKSHSSHLSSSASRSLKAKIKRK